MAANGSISLASSQEEESLLGTKDVMNGPD
jgi:hypothetical protein